MIKLIGICILAVTFFSTSTMAEDAVIADPAHYTVEFENDKIRVVRVKYGPGEKSVMHSHAAHASVILSDTTWRMTQPDGSSADAPVKTGDTSWADAGEHSPENLGEGPGEVILVEIKD